MSQFAPPPADDKDKDKSKSSAHDQELAKLRSQAEENERKMKTFEAEATAEKTKARTQRERTALRAALTEHGVTNAGGADAYLYLDKKRVKLNDEDKVCMSFQREWGEELVPVAAGVKEWLATDEGKGYLPPVDAAGSGNRGGRPPARKPGEKPSRAELMGHLGNQMLAGANSATGYPQK